MQEYMTAKISAISNLVSVIVGEQLPYLGDPFTIPGSFHAGQFDIFEGGMGQGISYSDVSPGNNGNFRPNENVDASLDASEGETVGWISSGEWLEYTIDVQQQGYYSLAFRYASGNNNGGGPFQLELNGEVIKSGITVGYTGDWGTWATKNVTDIPLKVGKQVLRIFFSEGEFNLGKLTFTYGSPLLYDQPIADAGDNILVVLPNSTTNLDGTNSIDSSGNVLSYSWTQVYGPSTLTFSDPQIAQPSISTLVEGVYLVKLVVDNGMYSDEDEIYIISSNDSNVAPKVSIITPNNEAEYLEGDQITISATASDLIGFVERIEFYADSQLLGTDNTSPYSIDWTPPAVGVYDITAVAFDNDSSSTTSAVVEVTITPAPSCFGTSFNGDFSYQFSDDDNNPTITFIPSGSGVGTPTCILYYGTNPGSLPGYGVTPNVPFQLNASEGDKIYFYYTYSFPGAVEKNNADNKDSYVIGSCRTTSIDDLSSGLPVKYYPNPVTSILNLELPIGKNNVSVYDLAGKLIDSFIVSEQFEQYNMSELPSGLYLFNILNNGKSASIKVVK